MVKGVFRMIISIFRMLNDKLIIARVDLER
jgi:hypothetical protein